MSTFLKYLHVYQVQLKNNFVREAIYRTHFLTALLTDFIWILIEFSFFSVIYSNVPTLAGWEKNQVYFFLGILFSSDALFTIFFNRNFWEFSNLVNHGDLDIVLTKPIHPLFLTLSRSIQLTAVFNFLLGLWIIFQFAPSAHFPGGAHWCLIPFWLTIGLVSALLMRFFSCVWVFWTERSWSLSRLYYQFFNLGTKPDVLYPKIVRYLILSILPFGFIASIPSRALLFGLSKQEYLQVACTLSLFYLLNSYLWKKGLLRYQSASS